jgi:hypothetical protein
MLEEIQVGHRFWRQGQDTGAVPSKSEVRNEIQSLSLLLAHWAYWFIFQTDAFVVA